MASAQAEQQRSPPNIISEHSWPSSETRDALSKSPFFTLPSEIIFRIFRLLSVHDLGNVSLVCRSLKMIADQDDIWKTKCHISTKLYSKSFKQIYIDWIHEKYLRNQELHRIEKRFNSVHYACGMRRPPPRYPLRPPGKHRFSPIASFDQHPNSSEEMIIQLSVDLDKTARELISLLDKASQFKDNWRNTAITKQMIVRYYRFMQLKVSCPQNILLVPTLDIEIVWQTHLLRPSIYRADCLRLFHRVIDHSLLTTDIEQFLKKQAFIDTCQLYEQRFGEQYCQLPVDNKEEVVPKYVHPPFGSLQCLIPVYSYWDATSFEFSSTSPSTYENPFSFTEADIILDGNWFDLCKNFMYQMVCKIDRQYDSKSKLTNLSSSALRRLKKSYERFLYLAAKYPSIDGYEFIHPTYAIDIIWHSHMQEPVKYANDCVRVVGYVIDHAPWPSVETDTMEKSCDDTNSNWKKEFESDMCTDHLYNTVNESYDS